MKKSKLIILGIIVLFLLSGAGIVVMSAMKTDKEPEKDESTFAVATDVEVFQTVPKMEGKSISITDATDIMGRLIQHVRPHWKIGKVLLGVDFFIVFLSLITFKTTEAVLYGIIALFISTYSIDWLMKTLNISKLAFVITDKGVDISGYLISTSPRGVTLVNGTGAYTQKDRQILICALKDSEIPEFQRKILSLDENAFIIYSESQQIVGKGFYIYG